MHGWTCAKLDPTGTANEHQAFLETGLDGRFSNFPNLAVRARDALVAARK